MDARARLGPNLVPVSKVVNEKVNHVAFDDVHVERRARSTTGSGRRRALDRSVVI